MRAGSFTLIATAILLAGMSAAAQQRPLPPPVIAPMPAAPPRPAPAALSVPNPLAGLQPGPRDLYQSPDGSDRFQHLSQYPVPPVVGGPIYPGTIYPPYFYPAPYYETSMAETYRSVMAGTYLRQHREAVAHGGLVLQDVPGIAHVYVDGYYVGTAEEFEPGGRAIDLSAGAHRIELRSPGYDTLGFSVMTEPHAIVRYRGDMQQVTTRPAAAATLSQPAAAKNIYVIPNCYAGDKPPTTALPKGCELKNLKTRK